MANRPKSLLGSKRHWNSIHRTLTEHLDVWMVLHSVTPDDCFREQLRQRFQMDSSAYQPKIPEMLVKQLINQLYSRHLSSIHFNQLKAVGEQALPYLIRALSDPKTIKTVFTTECTDRMDHSPFERIVDLIEPYAPADAVKSLSMYLKLVDPQFRQNAAVALGNIANMNCVAPLRLALVDHNEHVRSYALIGIENAITHGRASREFLGAMYTAIAKQMDFELSTDIELVVQLLISIDTQSALELLLSAKYVNSQYTHLARLLAAFNKSKRRLDHSILLPLVEELAQLTMKYPHDAQFAQALIAFALNPDSNTEYTYRKALCLSSEVVQHGAVRALSILFKLDDLPKYMMKLSRQLTFNEMSHQQQLYHEVFLYHNVMIRGGHYVYFANCKSARWEFALEGLHAINSKRRAAILQDAAGFYRRFGHPLAKRRQDRNADLRRLFRNLADLDNQYRRCRENVNFLLALYAIMNREHFTS